MDRISVGQAITAGFRLIGREPLSFLAWCGLCFLLSALPQAFNWSQMAPMLQAMGEAGAAGEGAGVLETQAQLMRVQSVSYLSALALMLVLPAAIFRAVLRPQERSFFYLRLGAREGWTWLVTVVLIVMFFAGALAAMIPVFVIAGVAMVAGGSGAGSAVGALLAFLLIFPLIGVLIWAALRFSMAPVISFAEREFRLPESWKFTKTHASSLFLVALGLLGIVILVELLLMGIIVTALLGSVGAANLQGLFQDPDALMRGPGLVWIGLALVLWTVLITGNHVMWTAAWADMYRQLRPADLAETFD